MRKRISSVLAGLLAALLLWGLAPVTAEAAGASFSGSGSVRAGDSVTVTFTVSGSNIQGITAVLHYDSSALTLTGTRQLVGSSWSVDMSGGNYHIYFAVHIFKNVFCVCGARSARNICARRGKRNSRRPYYCPCHGV